MPFGTWTLSNPWGIMIRKCSEGVKAEKLAGK
jgi:hypothetical protein